MGLRPHCRITDSLQSDVGDEKLYALVSVPIDIIGE